MLLSQKYHDSKNCKKEAEYADNEEKTILPILAEANYKVCQQNILLKS